MIDNGASFFFHHSWKDFDKAAQTPFTYVKDHALLPQASDLEQANEFAHQRLSDTLFQEIVQLLPDEWLSWEGVEQSPEQIREVYYNFLKNRLKHSSIFTKEAQNARKQII